MTRINLLPWRQQRREGQQRQFMGFLVGVVVFAAVGVFAVHLYVQELVDQQNERNNFLRGEIAKLKKIESEIEILDSSILSILKVQRKFAKFEKFNSQVESELGNYDFLFLKENFHEILNSLDK